MDADTIDRPDLPEWANTPAKRARNHDYWQAHNARILAEHDRKRWHVRRLRLYGWAGRLRVQVSLPIPWYGRQL